MEAVQEAVLRDPQLMTLAGGEADPRVIADMFRARGVPNMPPGLQPNLRSSMFEGIPNIRALTAAAVAMATPVFTGIGKGITDKATNFITSLFGNSGAQAQEIAMKDLADLQVTGTTNNEGLAEVMSVADPGAVRDFTAAVMEVRNPILFKSLMEMQIPGGSLFGSDIRDLQTLAPGMDFTTARIAAITDLPRPMPKVAQYSDSVSDSFNSAESVQFSVIKRAHDFYVRQGVLNQPRPDNFSTQANINAQMDVYADAIDEDAEARRKEMINIINTANQFNENQEIELMEDEFMANLQEQRINVNQRPVPDYSLTKTRINGLFIPIKYSPFVQQ